MYTKINKIYVDKTCYIAVYSNPNRYILDIIAAEHTTKGFVNFQLSIDTEGSCCETNDLYDSFSYPEDTPEEVPDRISSRWGLGVRCVHMSTRVVKSVVVSELDKLPEGEYDGGAICVKITFLDNTSTQVTYSNFHNGYYAHSVELARNGQVFYKEML